MSDQSFSKPPPPVQHVLITYPAPHVLLVTFNLAKQMNSLPVKVSWQLSELFKWFDDEPDLRVGIVTGAGRKAFCAGMDLKEAQTALFEKDILDRHYPDDGFAALTNRKGKKPIISAVNGHAHGGGMEIALNSDLVIASENATFSLPDVKRGTAGLQGGLPRLSKLFGLQRAMLVALTGYVLQAQEAKEWGLVFKVTKQDDLIDEAVKMAMLIASMSPDSVIASRAGVRAAWEAGTVEEALEAVLRKYGADLFRGENAVEGMRAFAEKRKPIWKGSKL